jgi:hypothetical protein
VSAPLTPARSAKSDSPALPEVKAFKAWLSTWSGIGHVVVGMERHGFLLSLRRLVDDGWSASFFSHAMLTVEATAPPDAL